MEPVKEHGKSTEFEKRKWKKGESGNPKGRTPNDCSFTIAAKEYLYAHPEVREKIIEKVSEAAQQGKEWATKLYWGYMDGAIPASIDLTSKGEKLENPIVAAIVTALK